MAHLHAQEFPERARDALTDGPLRQAIARATDTIGDRRAKAVLEIPEWEELREQARAVKAHTLARLDHYLLQFVGNAERQGIVVHWARDHAEACSILGDLAAAAGAHPIAKSKSMVTEEIGLNRVLEERGLRPVETDLGEWIVQLAGEMPSHIIVPAIHKSRQQIADLFASKLNVDRTEDPAELTRIARRILREEFVDAGLGISGVNFAIAETGSILLLENEGNIRLTTSLPKVHVAVMGVEKLLPRLADLEVFLRLLPRSGTGQRLTTYQSLLTGAKRRLGDEGPEAVHLLILDNGRSSMLRNELERETLACIRCGACLNACPVYRHVGGHSYGSVYPGPIGAIVTPQLAGIGAAGELPFASSLCGACRDVCPVKIDIPRMLLRLRARAVAPSPGESARPRPWSERLGFRLWAWAMTSASRYRLTSRLARWFHGPLVRFGPLRAWCADREPPRPAPRPFRDLWEKGSIQ
ncbi:MAG: iron-sulfur cluster-binding protein [Planctomycetes bacterium]|nr:iron-sulfur cluster-binding protein [Planctomycetota bacterium]